MMKKENKNTIKKFNSISIGFASPEVILEQSSGEVLKPETINYRSYKPERDGLFCERIFGPTKDFECGCGKYRRIRYRGIVCDRCGVEVTEKKVRRDRMGHINLVVPVAHVWYFRTLPNKIAYLLGLASKDLNKIIYYECYVVVRPGVATKPSDNSEDTRRLPLAQKDFLTEDEYLDVLDHLPEGNQSLEDGHEDKFVAKMGAECLVDLLDEINIEELSDELRKKFQEETAQNRKDTLLKRIAVVDSFKASLKNNRENKLSWMILKTIPIIPPELRPLVPLDGGRFATSDLNDLYRRVIIRNNRLKRLLAISAPEVILRNEKRMLQESVDALFDNATKSSAVKSDVNRPLKSLSDYLKGKQGRFRQNLLGKRVDYSARSVIVVGPYLKMSECGLPKEMAIELYKPFVIRRLLDRGMVKTVKAAKKMIEKKEPAVWEILENVLKGHPILLNRAPTLHRLGIQAFQPLLIEGKAIQLHPLVCTAFNADFDGDQMAVHLPLGSEAILEAQLLLLASHNILNPANGSPVTVPSQDMVLGLYYMTKELPLDSDAKIMRFYGPEEVVIAYNEGIIKLNTPLIVRTFDVDEATGKRIKKRIRTTTGRVLFNRIVPEQVGYVNEVLNKKALRTVISKVLKLTDIPTTSNFLDGIKDMGFKFAFQGGLSFSLADIIIPDEKEDLIKKATDEVNEVADSYAMGVITNQERYNKVVDIWGATNSELTEASMKRLTEDQQGFNSVYMMLDSGARGSREQIRQLTGMRGLMAKPKKSNAGGGEIIENPIISNFKEGLSILEYFISTHGARKGLADTALKTADAGYLTRRLVDVSQDVIVNEHDCGTLRGLKMGALKKNDEIKQPISERIVGRFTVDDVYHPQKDELLIASGALIDAKIAAAIEASGLEHVFVRSPLTCDAQRGICVKCYGKNLATDDVVQEGEAVGVVAAQSIGEPGTQLTLRTFHVGGVAGNISEQHQLISKHDGRVQINDLKSVMGKDQDGKPVEVVISRIAEIKIIDEKTDNVRMTDHLEYGSHLFVKQGENIKKGKVLCQWDPFNGVIVSEFSGKVTFDKLEQDVNYKIHVDEQTGFEEIVIIESKGKKVIPSLMIQDDKGTVRCSYELPRGGNIIVKDGQHVQTGAVLVKNPRNSGRSADITGGLPRVTELFEARNPSNTAVVSETNGVVSFGVVRASKRVLIVTTKPKEGAEEGEAFKYDVPNSHQILVQKGDFVKVGTPLTDGSVTPSDILRILGPEKVQEYLVNEIQDVYRLQGVKINDKHFEVIIRQMMKRVSIINPGDTKFLQAQKVDKVDFINKNNEIFGKKIVLETGGSKVIEKGQVISVHALREQNALLAAEGKELVEVRDAQPALAEQVLQGITRVAINTKSFISAASFQETTRVLNEAAIAGKVDDLIGLKENVIVGKRIPAGTGMKQYENIVVPEDKAIENMELG